MIELRKGPLQALIAPEKGATLVQLTADGVDYLYRDEDNLRSPERPRCGVPFLFPIFGRLRNGCYNWEGNTYAMGIHGFGHTSRWQVVGQQEDRAVLVLESGPETRAVYPFDFRVTMTVTLDKASVTVALVFENTGTAALPFNYGFHPYFLTERAENVQTHIQAEAKIDFASGKALPFGSGTVILEIPKGAPEAGAALAKISSPAVIRIPAEGRQITMEFDESYSQMVFWAQTGKHFLCVEPINGSPDGLNTGNYMTLAPGEIRESFLRLTPEQIGKETL